MPNPESDFARLQSLFHELETLDRAQQKDRLNDIASNEPALAAELKALLDTDAGSRFVSDMAEQVASLTTSPEPAIKQLGPFEIIRELGRGGMGRVFEARQRQPVERRVALKVMRAGLFQEEASARFQAERQALASLNHPNIAKLYDAGSTEDGYLWFAMELVAGDTVTSWATSHHLSIRDRITLLLPICDAIQHAHQKGLIHRDIKPGNLLVDEQEGHTIPRVIDFGIAKNLRLAEDKQSQHTRAGDMLGTPEYMSPEQASLGELDVDTRTDVYALGLVLHELVLGRLPLDRETLQQMSYGELCREIRRERPVLSPQERISSISHLGSIEKDLALILDKALATDRELRYPSAAALAEDLRRYLRHDPVSAAPPSLRYRTGKFIRRNKAWAAALGLATVALLSATIIANIGMQQARQAEQKALLAAQQAQREQRTAQEATEFMVDLFRAADPSVEPGLEASAADLLNRGEQRINELADEPGIQAELLAALGSAYYMLGESGKAESLLRRAYALRGPGPSEDPIKRAAVASKLADLLRESRDYAEAEALYRTALDRLTSLGQLTPEDEIVLRNGLGISLIRTGKTQEAESVFTRALLLIQSLPQTTDAEISNVRNHRINVYSSLAGLYAAQQRFTEAARMTQGLLDELSAVLPQTHPNIAILHTNLSVMQASSGDLQNAYRHARISERLSIESLGEQHPRTATHLLHLGHLQWRLNQLDAAQATLEKAISIFTQVYDNQHPELVRPLAELARVHARMQQIEQALPLLESALQIVATQSDSTPAREPALLWAEVARYKTVLGQTDEASAAFQKALQEATQSGDTLLQARVEIALGWHHAIINRQDSALQHMQRAEELARCDETPCSLDQADKGITRAQAYAALGLPEKAMHDLHLATDQPGWVSWLMTLPEFAPLRSHSDWSELEQKIQTRVAAISMDVESPAASQDGKNNRSD